MPVLTNKNTQKVEEKKVVTVKSDAVVAAEMPIQAVAKNENLGKKSAMVEFVAPLGDPSQDDVTYIPDPNGGKSTAKVDPIIVGYRFKALEDMDVPNVLPGQDFKRNLMSFTGDPSATVHVKAGETFDLTKFETGLLISREEYNGKFTGGQMPVTCTYTKTTKKTSTGAIATTLAQSTIPTVALRASSGSIKNIAMIPVLTFTAEKGEGNRTTRKHRTIIKGFEKFSPLCIEYVQTGRGSRSTGTASAAEARNKSAAMFLQIAMSKKAPVVPK